VALLSAAELTNQAEGFLFNRTFQCLLCNNNATVFNASTNYAEVVAAEVNTGDGGYSRLEFTYEAGDLADIVGGVIATTKRVNFIHDGSANPIVFDHLVIVEKIVTGQVETFEVVAIQPLGYIARLDIGGDIAQFVVNARHKNI
jgi:hypothetical protein